MESIESKINIQRLKKIVPVVLGAAGGFLYYSFIGCATGTCAITSNPWSSTVVGAIIGLMLTTKNKKIIENTSENILGKNDEKERRNG